MGKNKGKNEVMWEVGVKAEIGQLNEIVEEAVKTGIKVRVFIPIQRKGMSQGQHRKMRE